MKYEKYHSLKRKYISVVTLVGLIITYGLGYIEALLLRNLMYGFCSIIFLLFFGLFILMNKEEVK